MSPLAATLVPPAAILALVTVLGHVSGAHFNPAITLAFSVTDGFPVRKVRRVSMSITWEGEVCITREGSGVRFRTSSPPSRSPPFSRPK